MLALAPVGLESIIAQARFIGVIPFEKAQTVRLIYGSYPGLKGHVRRWGIFNNYIIAETHGYFAVWDDSKFLTDLTCYVPEYLGDIKK